MSDPTCDVAILMGSKSDLTTMKPAADVLKMLPMPEWQVVLGEVLTPAEYAALTDEERETLDKRREELQATLKHAGVDLLELSTDGDMARDIMRFSSARSQRRRGHSSHPLARPRAG